MNGKKNGLAIDRLHELYRSGAQTPLGLINKLKARIEETADYNIWITVLDDTALSDYAGRLSIAQIDELPLFGIPFAIKDNIDLAGVATTAACPEFSYVPERSAFAVQRLLDAGAIPIGKTNMDQFATGLVGTRTPHGATRNSIDPEYISGGSSSGSAVATALGLVSFALGTDTAGSGRVPAAFNDIIGIKPGRGLVSMAGVVPACRSLDCVSLFTRNMADAIRICRELYRVDEEDPYSRALPSKIEFKERFTIGVPKPEQREFFGNAGYQALYDAAVTRFADMGAAVQEIDFTPFLEAAALLYDGPWLAERYLAVQSLLEQNPSALHPITRQIIEQGKNFSATDAYAASYRLQALKQKADRELAGVDFIVTPTAGTIYRRSEIDQQPLLCNSNLGYYTNFMNLLDYSAVAIPAGRGTDGLPFGITLFGQVLSDFALMAYGAGFLAENIPGRLMPVTGGGFKLVVCGAHMSGMPLNGELTDIGASLVSRTRTAACYRLYDLADGSNRPGLFKVDNDGRNIEVEVWAMPGDQVADFLAKISPPLGISSVELADHSIEKGFLCEAYALGNAIDVSQYGGWRAYLDSGRN